MAAILAVALAAPPVAQPPVRLHIEVVGRREVSLFRLSSIGDPSARTRVCTAPCDSAVGGRDGALFVVDGPRMVPSQVFTLVDMPERVSLVVRPGRRGLTIAGWTLAALGGVAVLAGGITLTLADDDRTLRRAGGFTLLGGLAFAIAGGTMAAFGPTRYRFAAPGRERRRRVRD